MPLPDKFLQSTAGTQTAHLHFDSFSLFLTILSAETNHHKENENFILGEIGGHSNNFFVIFLVLVTFLASSIYTKVLRP